MDSRSLALMVIVLLMAILGGIWEVKTAGAAPTPAQCQKERDAGLRACLPVFQGNNPPRQQVRQCCKHVKKIHLECVCPLLNSNIPRNTVNRALRLAKDCGRKLPRRYKCGSVTIP